jgi:hypothetical protein
MMVQSNNKEFGKEINFLKVLRMNDNKVFLFDKIIKNIKII